MKIACCIRLEDSFKRFKYKFEDKEIEWDYLPKLKNLQEEIIIKHYDIIIVDEKIDFKDEAINIISKKQSIKILIFKGEFHETFLEIEKRLNNNDLQDEEDSKEDLEELPEDEEILEDRYANNDDRKIRYVEVEVEKVKEVEKIVEVEVEKVIEKPVIIEKEIEIEKRIKVLNNSVISIISSKSTGKSFLTWVLSNCFSDKNYKTTLINIDKGYSANDFFGIEGNMLTGYIEKLSKDYINENSYQYNKYLNIITGERYKDKVIDKDTLSTLINLVSNQNDVILIDTKSELNELTKTALLYSNITILVFDLNPFHYNLNMIMLKEYLDIINTENTIIVINNAYDNSKELKEVIKKIKSENIKFKNIITIRSCGAMAVETMATDTTPYKLDEKFKKDIDLLLEELNISRETKKRSFLSRLFKSI